MTTEELILSYGYTQKYQIFTLDNYISIWNCYDEKYWYICFGSGNPKAVHESLIPAILDNLKSLSYLLKLEKYDGCKTIHPE